VFAVALIARTRTAPDPIVPLRMLYEALAGHREAARRHLAIAFANDPRTRAWAADDADLAGVEPTRQPPSLNRSVRACSWMRRGRGVLL
jgi:hypothetical protein